MVTTKRLLVEVALYVLRFLNWNFLSEKNCFSQGPTWQGTSGVHTHMTNTRITDPEILEIRYPMILNKFCLRDDGSGGKGLLFEQTD